MRRTLHTATLGVLALALGIAVALPPHAQDRSNDQRDQTTTRTHQATPNEHRTQQYDNRGAVRSDQRQITQDDTRAQDDTRGAARSDEQRASRQDRRDATRSDERRNVARSDEPRDVARSDERRGDSDDVTGLRHSHPRAAARCHDGFYTNTRDRARACSKHGGIEIWLGL